MMSLGGGDMRISFLRTLIHTRNPWISANPVNGKNMYRLIKFNFLVALFCIGCTSPQYDIIRLNPRLSNDFSVFLKEKLGTVKNGIVKLEFERGTYHFYPENATEKYLTISNNDNGYKKIAFPFFDYSIVEINKRN